MIKSYETKDDEFFGQYDSNSYKIYFLKLITTILSLFIILVLYYFKIISIIFQNNVILLYFNLSIGINRDFTIIIHSSEKTKSRLDLYLKHYIKKKRYIHILVAYGDGSNPDPRFESIITRGCQDSRAKLDCKNDFIYNYFIKNESLGDFLYRAMDDTILNITNLEKLINQLRKIYNPMTDIVFRGYANDEFRERVYLGGGSGWLMSRAFVSLHNHSFYSFQTNIKNAFYKQDDTAESIVIQKVGFKTKKAWNDPRWAENSITRFDDFNISFNGFISRLENCSNNVELIPINQMISMHATSYIGKSNWITSQTLLSNANNIYVYKMPFSQYSQICKAKPGILNNRTTFEYLKDNAEYIRLDEILQRNNTLNNNTPNYIENK